MDLLGSAGLGGVVVVIPAWEPDGRLVALVEELAGVGFAGIVVVDDGSTAAAGVFAELRGRGLVRVVRHARNRGKGVALKTGMGVALGEMVGVRGVVTADADGQHTAADIVRVASALEDEVVLGVRTFSGKAPLRCRVGNEVTRGVFGLVTGVWLGDTQTGLRGFPRAVLEAVVGLEGERYEYEMVVLAYVCRGGRRPVEVPIETVYLEGNRSSHFKPLVDSARVLWALVRSVRGGG